MTPGRRAFPAALAAVIAVHAAFTLRFWWVNDDAFISFRFARNLAEGAGLRFNVGETPVEGYSNFLWVALGAGVHAVGLDVVRWLPVLSWLCGAGLVALLLQRLVRVLEVPLPIATVAVLGLAAYPPFAVWSTGGLATMPFALLVFLTFDRLVLAPGGPDALRGGLFGALLALVRVEGAAWFAVVLALAWLAETQRGRRAGRALLKAAGIVALVFGGWFAWRAAYYGTLVPNTVVAKQVSGSVFLLRGYRYVMASALTFLVPFAIVPGALVALRRGRRAAGLGVAALAWGFPVYAVVVSGDYMPMGRFLVPGLAFTTILVAWLLADLAGRDGKRTTVAVALGGVLAVAGALPGWDVHLVPRAARSWTKYRLRRAKQHHSEVDRWAELRDNVQRWRQRGRMARAWADATLDPPVSMAIRALGAMGWETDFRMLDCAGLLLPEIARTKVEQWEDQPGHDKAVPLAWFVDRSPTVLQVWDFEGDPVAAGDGVARALGSWRDSPARARYRPELVAMVPSGGGERSYLLVLVHDEAARPEDWEALEENRPDDLRALREIPYRWDP